MKFNKKPISFVEWMEEDKPEVTNATISLHGNRLYVSNDSGEFDIELPNEVVSEIGEKIQSLVSNVDDQEPDQDDGGEDMSHEEPDDDEDAGMGGMGMSKPALPGKIGV